MTDDPIRDAAERHARESAAAQGLPERVEDTGTVDLVAALLTKSRAAEARGAIATALLVEYVDPEENPDGAAAWQHQQADDAADAVLAALAPHLFAEAGIGLEMHMRARQLLDRLDEAETTPEVRTAANRLRVYIRPVDDTGSPA